MTYDLDQPSAAGVVVIAAAERPVTLRIVDKASGQPRRRAPAPPRRGRRVPAARAATARSIPTGSRTITASSSTFASNTAMSKANASSTCRWAPARRDHAATRRFPSALQAEITPQTEELHLRVGQVLHWPRQAGSPRTPTSTSSAADRAARRARRGLNVVNLLASQWGEMFSNVSDFDGRTTFGRQGLRRRRRVLGAWAAKTACRCWATFRCSAIPGR